MWTKSGFFALLCTSILSSGLPPAYAESAEALPPGSADSVYAAQPLLAEPVPAAPPSTPVSTPLPATPAALEDVLAHVYMSHPQLRAERESLRILDEKVAQANAGYRPNVSASADYGRQRFSVNSADWQYGEANNKALVAEQPLFKGFGTIAQSRAAKERVQAGRARLLATEQGVFLAVLSSWLEVCEKDQLLLLNQDNAMRLRTYLQATQERFDAGDGTLTDVAVAESRMNEAYARLALAEANRDVAHAAYQRETGMAPFAVTYPTLTAPLPRNREEAVQLAEGNPDLKEAMHIEQAAEHDIDRAGSSLWPSLSLKGSMSEERSTAFGLGKLRSDSLLLSLSVPLYQGGAEYSRLREAKIAKEEKRFETLDTERLAKQRASNAWSNYYVSEKVIVASQASVNASKQALSGLEEEQIQGTRTLTEVLDAQTELFNAQISEVQAQKSVRLEAYRLLASIGRLTAEGLQLPVHQYDPVAYANESHGRWVGTSITNPGYKNAGTAP